MYLGTAILVLFAVTLTLVSRGLITRLIFVVHALFAIVGTAVLGLGLYLDSMPSTVFLIGWPILWAITVCALRAFQFVLRGE